MQGYEPVEKPVSGKQPFDQVISDSIDPSFLRLIVNSFSEWTIFTLYPLFLHPFPSISVNLWGVT